MRILQVTPSYFPAIGGLEHHVQDVSEGLARLGHSVTVLTASRDRSLAREAVVNGVVIRRLPAIGPQAYQIPIGMYAYLRRHGPDYDVVHAHSYHAVPMLLAALACGRRTVITPHYHGHGHTRLANWMHPVYGQLAIPALGQVGGVVCVSHAEADLVAAKLHIPRQMIGVVPNVVALANRDDGVAETVAFRSRTDVVLLSVGRLEPYKRVDRIIRAVACLPEHYRLIVIGTGRERVHLGDLAAALGTGSRVEFLSGVSDEDLQGLYANAHVLVSLSEAEAFGRTVLEALTGGCRVVCSDIPAYREFASEFGSWISLVPADMDARQVAGILQAAATMAGDDPPDLLPYAWQSVVGRLVQVYAEVASRNRPNALDKVHRGAVPS